MGKIIIPEQEPLEFDGVHLGRIEYSSEGFSYGIEFSPCSDVDNLGEKTDG